MKRMVVHVIDVVIPAREEDPSTLGPTLQAFRDAQGIGRIILVDDRLGWDRPQMEQVGAMADVVVMRYEHTGKGQAVQEGLTHVNTNRVILCDGDLTGFTSYHAELLAAPYSGMILGTTDYVRGEQVPWPVPPDMWALVTGERSLPTHLVEELPLHGYAMEVQINRAVIESGLSIRAVKLKGCKGTPRWGERRQEEMIRDGRWLAQEWDGK
jgi:hypothetical protein